MAFRIDTKNPSLMNTNLLLQFRPKRRDMPLPVNALM
jgi:hypothetical protein